VNSNARFGDLTLADFVGRLASPDPVPGGGSAAAVAGSLAAALVTMVARLSQGRPRYAVHEALHSEALSAGRALADRFLALADEDAEAYAQFGAAMKLPRETDAEREARASAIDRAARAASDVPYRTVETCLEVAGLAEALSGRCNLNASSDLEVASLLALAAARGAAANVRVNLPSIQDQSFAGDLLARTESLLDEVERLADHACEVVRGGGMRDALEVPAR
jgi:glutamate formiminotransferase/formiminotetrahydrofolate cyclodeaminase